MPAEPIIVEEAQVPLGNVLAVVTKYSNGVSTFRQKPDDMELIQANITDNLGRELIMTVHSSTALIMVPSGDFGAVLCDPIMIGPNMRAMDGQGRHRFTQRAPIAREEVFDLARKAAEKADSRIIMP